MTRAEILAFFDARGPHWQARDPIVLANGHSERGVVSSPIFGTLHGREAIANSYRSLFAIFPDWLLTPEPPLIDGMRVAQPFSVTATHAGEFFGVAGTNRRFEIHGVQIMEMGDGLIQRERRLYDFTGLLIQIGVLRPRPA